MMHPPSIRFPKLGYYTVGQQAHESKISACIEATQTQTQPQWHFNDATWQAKDWQHEPEADIETLYQKRARQLREQYDWITISFSGGSDSHNIVRAFLDAGLWIDEIVTSWSRDVTDDQVVASQPWHAANINHEFDLACKPILDQVRLQSPHTKIRYHDVGQDIIEKLHAYDRHDDWCQRSYEHFSPLLISRFDYNRHRDSRTLLDRGRRQAFVTGIDKPRVCLHNGRYAAFFLDSIINGNRCTLMDETYTNLNYEFFYWTPDLPDIVIKQSHMLMSWFKQNPRLEPLLQWGPALQKNRTMIEALTRSIIYPYWDANTFQVDKPSVSAYQEYDRWFFDQRDAKALNIWQSGVDRTVARIDPKFLQYNNGVMDGFLGMHNGFFYLEPVRG